MEKKNFFAKKKENVKKTVLKKENKKVVIQKKEKKDNIFKRIFKYFKGVVKEVKRVRWTDKKELLKYSVATVLFVCFFALYFYAIDWLVLLIRSLAK